MPVGYPAARLHKDVNLVLEHRSLADEHAGEDALNLAWTNGMTLLGLAMVLGSLALTHAFHGWMSWLWTAASIEAAFGVGWILFVRFWWRAYVVAQSTRRIASGWAVIEVIRVWTDLITRLVFAPTLGAFVTALLDHWKTQNSEQRAAFAAISIVGAIYALRQFRQALRQRNRYDAPTS
jgi:hypothetical protein